jgi:hypothetical protein
MKEIGRALIQGAILAFVWRDWEKPRIISVRITGPSNRANIIGLNYDSEMLGNDFFICIYLTTLLTTKTIYRQMTGWLINE